MLQSMQTVDDVTANPGLIHEILLQYFDDASSCLPLADFYTTCLDLTRTVDEL